jgi:hypothetical protein
VKNLSRVSIAFVLVLTLFFVSVPGKVVAKPHHPVQEVAPGSWTWTAGVNGSEVQQDTLTTPAPTWRVILTKGLVLSGPAKICHEFTGNQNGWMGDIYLLSGDSWTKLATTVDWVPTIEGHLMACAQAPAAGTYALFGYWEKPADWQPTKICEHFHFSIKAEVVLFPICDLASDICLCVY